MASTSSLFLSSYTVFVCLFRSTEEDNDCHQTLRPTAKVHLECMRENTANDLEIKRMRRRGHFITRDDSKSNRRFLSIVSASRLQKTIADEEDECHDSVLTVS